MHIHFRHVQNFIKAGEGAATLNRQVHIGIFSAWFLMLQSVNMQPLMI